MIHPSSPPLTGGWPFEGKHSTKEKAHWLWQMAQIGASAKAIPLDVSCY